MPLGTQRPPFEHGLLEQEFVVIAIWHITPVKLEVHIQLKIFPLLTQVPEFIHGLLKHAFERIAVWH